MTDKELKCLRCTKPLRKYHLVTERLKELNPVYACFNKDCIGWFWVDIYEELEE
jgi:hypothetical protein